MIHKSVVEKYDGTMKELADDIGDLKYNALAEFLELLAAKIEFDGTKDEARGRVKLSENLFSAAKSLKDSQLAIEKAWVICAPYTK